MRMTCISVGLRSELAFGPDQTNSIGSVRLGLKSVGLGPVQTEVVLTLYGPVWSLQTVGAPP